MKKRESIITNPMTTRRRSNNKPLLVVGLCITASLFCFFALHTSFGWNSAAGEQLFFLEQEPGTKGLSSAPRSRKLRSKDLPLVHSSHNHAWQHSDNGQGRRLSRHEALSRQQQRGTTTVSHKRHLLGSIRKPLGRLDGSVGTMAENQPLLSPKKDASSSKQADDVWQDMDLRKAAARCGVEKCFFPSLSDASIGYLVAGSSMLKTMKEAYNLAQNLEEQFGMHHLNMDPPRLLPADAARIALLNSIVDQPGLRAGGYPPQDVYGTSADADDLQHLVVQQVRRAPEPHLFLTMAENKELTEQSIAKFAPLIGDPQAFDRRFWHEMQRIKQVLHAHPILHHDFQGLVDTTGHFYSMDLDVDDEWKAKPSPSMDFILRSANDFLEKVRVELWNRSFQRQQRPVTHRY